MIFILYIRLWVEWKGAFIPFIFIPLLTILNGNNIYPTSIRYVTYKVFIHKWGQRGRLSAVCRLAVVLGSHIRMYIYYIMYIYISKTHIHTASFPCISYSAVHRRLQIVRFSSTVKLHCASQYIISWNSVKKKTSCRWGKPSLIPNACHVRCQSDD